MGSLERGVPLKRDPLLLSSSNGRSPFLLRPRSKFSRFLLLKRLDYLQWICTVAVFLFFVVLFQMYLPGSVVEDEKSGDLMKNVGLRSENLRFLKELGLLDFGEDIRFEPSKLLEKFQKEAREASLSPAFNWTRQQRFGYRKPQLALVFADLSVDSQQLLMVTVAAALQEIGYTLSVYSIEDGPVHDIWRGLGVPVTIIQTSDQPELNVDWLNYNGILVNSLQAKGIFSWSLSSLYL